MTKRKIISSYQSYVARKIISNMLQKILNKNEDNVPVTFLRKRNNASLIFYTDQQKIYFLDVKNIIVKQPKPRALGTARTKGLLSFDVKISKHIS